MQRAKPRPPATTFLLLVSGVVFFSFMPETLFSVSKWQRLISSIVVYENGLFFVVVSIFLLLLGGPFENRQGTRHFIEVFLGSTIVSLVVLGAFTWGRELMLAGGLVGTGGIVGAWTVEAYGRKRVSYYKSVVMRDFEELPAFLVLALWLFALFTLSVLFVGDIVSYFLAICAATLAGVVIHLACGSQRSKLKI